MTHKNKDQLAVLYERVNRIYLPFEIQAAKTIPESEAGDLRAIVRITIETVDYIEENGTPVRGAEAALYMCETIFSGISSFCTITETYNSMKEARPSQLSSGVWSLELLTSEIERSFARFLDESDFCERCRLILDVFKLQMMLAGLVYQ